MNQPQVIETYRLSHLKKGDFITELYNRYGRKLYSYARHTWKTDEDDTWSIVYDTLYKVTDSYRKYSFDNEEKFASFVFRIFINRLRNHYRDTRQERESLQVTPIEELSFREPANPQPAEQSTSDRMQKLSAELEQLADWERILLLMRSDGRSYGEIAGYTGKPADQLKVYYQRLKKRLTDKLNGPQ